MQIENTHCKIRLLFFGATAEIVGSHELEFDVGECLSSADVLGLLSQKFPALGRHKLLVSVNHVYGSGLESLRDGDELAIFTAVSGG